MSKIIISTESGSDLSKELMEQYQINVVPLHVVMDGKSYFDGSFPISDLYQYYNKTKKVPSTSAANPDQFSDFFHTLQKENPGCKIIHISYSSAASSTYQNAKIAIDELDDVYLVDSLNVSGGAAAITVKAAQIVASSDENCNIEDIIKEIEFYVKKARVSFLPGSLEYLKAGGRVSNVVYLGASLLKIKPLVKIIDGKLIVSKKYRGQMSSIVNDYINEFITENHLDKSIIYFLYSLGLEESIKEAARQQAKNLGFQIITFIQTGCVITCHSGPGALGIAGFATN